MNPDSTTSSGVSPAPTPELDTFRISPIIRVTLLLLYVALTLPLPFLAKVTQAPVPSVGLAIALVVGWLALYAALTERVIANAEGIRVAYAAWVPTLFKKGWSLNWQDITALKPRSTGQGGIVYYFVSSAGQAYLLPMRVAGFARLVRLVQAKTGIDTTDVRPLSQPWMYFILFAFTLLLLLVDAWTLWTAAHLEQIGLY